jgi:diguanylate cyclase (GGDEF)-like protein
MFQRSAGLFALGHISIPLILFILYGSSGNQPIILAIAMVSLAWSLLLCWQAFIRKNLDTMLRRPVRWLFMWVDLVILSLIFTTPSWTQDLQPTWISLFLLFLYAGILGYFISFVFIGASFINLYLFSLAQNTPFLSSDTLLNTLGMITIVLLLGRYAEALHRISHYDWLTGLPNRERFKNKLSDAIEKGKARNKQTAVLFLDLDQFKYVNDTMGHSAGDKLLQTVAGRISAIIPSSAFLARMGGDEFALMLPDITRTEDIETVAQRLIEALQEPLTIEGRDIYITSSIGISLFPQDGGTTDVLMKNADSAMYWAKEQGRNNYQFYTAPSDGMAVERLTMESMLRKALEKEELEVYYQPRVCAKNEHVVAVEALVRWNHPEKGYISPMQFIPLAEDTGLIVPLGEYVLRTACSQMKQWHDAGLPKLRVSVNLSPRQFRQKDLVLVIQQILNETRLAPEHLELEITEGAAMQNTSLSVLVLRILKDLGVKVSIDDFGTGYSSLSYLKKLPIDAVKIDRSFIHGVDSDADDAAIASAIIALSHILGLKVTAEGVETKAQLDYLQSLNCDEVQGFLYGKAMPPSTFVEWIQLRSTVPDLIL